MNLIALGGFNIRKPIRFASWCRRFAEAYARSERVRTHASSAHGAGKRPYKLKPRHARLAIHAAHTISAFVIETWDEKSALEKGL
ncbi:abortive infection family protein [Pseudomonas abietaniphila]|uniref:abortive infection family protein n=1 Tax=Pseudomonas abietaniphila TaxID=89065 RepID=UPI003D3652E3